MKRLIVYTVSILILALALLLAVQFGVPEALGNWPPMIALRDRLVPPAPTVSPELFGMIEAFRGVDLAVIWVLHKPDKATMTVGFANKFPLTTEQAKRIDAVLNEYGLKLGLEFVVFWFWNERPENGWAVVGCNPDGCTLINARDRDKLIPVSVPEEQWQKYVVSTRWAR